MEKKVTSFTNLTLQRKKGHLQQIISISVKPDQNNIVATCAQDNTVRIWDFRQPISGKFFRNKELAGQLSNCCYGNNNLIYVAAGPQIYSFDSRKEGIMLSQILAKSQKHSDEVNHLTFDKDFTRLAACDDEGDCHLYNSNLQRTQMLDQEHTNITFCTEFINPEQYKSPVCVTCGFDLKLVFWNTQTSEPIKQVNIGQTLSKYTQTHCPPHPYSLTPLKSSVLISTQTGHILQIPFTEPKKPKFILTASLAKIPRCCFSRFHSNILLAIAADSTFMMFDFNKRNQENSPTMLGKFKTEYEPNWIESTKERILLADKSDCLSVYSFKQ